MVFSLKPAGPYARALAFFLDLLIQTGLSIVLLVLAKLFAEIGNWISLLLFFALQWLYSALFEGLNDGRSPGKMAMGLQVVHEDGTPLDLGSAFLRNVLRAADSFFFSFGIGFTVLAFTRKFQRLGDMAAGTIVVYSPKPGKRGPRIPQLPEWVQPMPPPRALSAEESRAIIAFAQRLEQFSQARARELAKGAVAGLYGADVVPEDPLDRVLALAAWLAGSRPVLGRGSGRP